MTPAVPARRDAVAGTATRRRAALVEVPGRVDRWRHSPEGTTVVRYVVTSGVSVVIGQLTLVVAFGALAWTARSANYLAFVVAGIPSYTLSRRWAWGRTGRSHLREVLPFWVIAFVGLAASTGAVTLADTYGQTAALSRPVRTLLLVVASLFAFGLVSIGKFVLLNRVLFGRPASAPLHRVRLLRSLPESPWEERQASLDLALPAISQELGTPGESAVDKSSAVDQRGRLGLGGRSDR